MRYERAILETGFKNLVKMSLRAALLGVAFSLVTESLATSNASGSNGTTSGDRPVISDGTIESMKDWLTQVNDQRSCRARTTRHVTGLRRAQRVVWGSDGYGLALVPVLLRPLLSSFGVCMTIEKAGE